MNQQSAERPVVPGASNRVTSLGAGRTRELVIAALLAALIAGTTWISIPIGPVSFTLQLVFVFLAVLLLDPSWAAASMLTYLILGAVGLPVFSKMQGGLGVLFGATGGFLIAFPIAAALGSAVRKATQRFAPQLGADVAGILSAEVVVYSLGLPWLMHITGLSLAHAAAVGMLPFLIPDAVKAALAVVLARAVRRARRA